MKIERINLVGRIDSYIARNKPALSEISLLEYLYDLNHGRMDNFVTDRQKLIELLYETRRKDDRSKCKSD